MVSRIVVNDGRIERPVECAGIPTQATLRYFAMSIALALLSDVPSTFGAGYLASKVFLYAVLVGSLFYSVRHGLVLLLLISVAAQDINQSVSEAEIYGTTLMASVWQGGLGPLRPSWFIMAYCLALLLKTRVALVWDRPVLYAACWCMTIPIATGILYGGFATPFAATNVIVDMKLPLMLISSILLYRTSLKSNPDFIRTIMAAFIAAVAARHLLTFVYWLVGIGSVHDGINMASVDSAKSTVTLLFLIAMNLVLLRKRPVVGGGLGVISGILVAVFITRLIWLTTIAGAVVTLLTMRLSRWVVALPIIAVLVFASLTLLERISPDNFMLTFNKGNRFSSDQTTENFLERQDPARYAELLNFLDTNIERVAVLWGSGYGSYYTESARKFPPKAGVDAFPDYMFESGMFFTCHDFVLVMLFKHGILGFIIVSCLWLVPGWRCFKLIRRYPPGHFSIFWSSMVAFLPTSILCLTWSGKGDIVSGFFVAFCLTFADRCQSKSATKRVVAMVPTWRFNRLRSTQATRTSARCQNRRK